MSFAKNTKSGDHYCEPPNTDKIGLRLLNGKLQALTKVRCVYYGNRNIRTWIDVPVVGEDTE